MKNIIDFKIFIPVMVVCGFIAFGVSYFASINFWVSFVIVVMAVFLTGLIATWEDEQPGGFNDPSSDKNDG